MAFVDESRTTNILANARKNIMEQTVNVSKIHNRTEIIINQGSKHFYSLERKFYILRAKFILKQLDYSPSFSTSDS